MWQVIETIFGIFIVLSVAIGILGLFVAILIWIFNLGKKIVEFFIDEYKENRRNVAEAKMKDQERRQAIKAQLLENERKYQEHERKYQEHERKESLKPENILRNNPDLETLREILETCESPSIRLLAIFTALESKDRYKISLVFSFINKHPDAILLGDPEKDKILISVFREKALMAIDDLDFPKLKGEECIDKIKKYSFLDNRPGQYGDWWRSWKPQLEARALQIIKERERKAADAIHQAQLEQAEAEGKDVCWECKTINPERCPWGCCISGSSPCSTNYGGYCYIHDYD